MMRSVKTWTRVGIAAAAAGVTAVGVVGTSGASTPALAANTTPGCHTAQLAVWRAAPASGVAGGWYYDLQFSNISSKTCGLYGFPGVSAVAANGHQLGSAASRDHRFAKSLVVLRPGSTAHAVLRLTDVSVYPPSTCKPTTAVGLRVYPPNTYTSVVVPLRFRACAEAGPTFLSVRTVRPGAGIPGYSQ
jgi:hypothetical protein